MTEPAPLSRPQLRRKLRQARRALTGSQQRQAAHGLYRQLAQLEAIEGHRLEPSALAGLPGLPSPQRDGKHRHDPDYIVYDGTLRKIDATLSYA